MGQRQNSVTIYKPFTVEICMIPKQTFGTDQVKYNYANRKLVDDFQFDSNNNVFICHFVQDIHCLTLEWIKAKCNYDNRKSIRLLFDCDGNILLIFHHFQDIQCQDMLDLDFDI